MEYGVKRLVASKYMMSRYMDGTCVDCIAGTMRLQQIRMDDSITP